VITAIALIALFTTDPLVTNAQSGLSIALLASGTDHVAFAGITLHIWIAPEVGLTFIASSAAESWLALASSVEGVASTCKIYSFLSVALYNFVLNRYLIK